MSQLQVLVVDDERNMRNLLQVYLGQSGCTVTQAKDGYEALRRLEGESFDVIVLDVMMPGMDGWEVCRKVRESRQIPILMLTARGETKDKIQGLNLGADDYLVKPFEGEELVARVFALARRPHMLEVLEREEVVQTGSLSIHPEGRTVFVHGQSEPVLLTPKEFDLLYLLVKRPQRVFRREELLRQIWGDDFFGDERTVDTHVKNIREKLRKFGLSYNPVQTVWGVGYKWHNVSDGQEGTRRIGGEKE